MRELVVDGGVREADAGQDTARNVQDASNLDLNLLAFLELLVHFRLSFRLVSAYEQLGHVVGVG